MVTLDAILLADVAPIGARVGGLTLVERARRIAARAGARRVLVVDGPTARAGLAAWWAASDRAEALLVLRAGDQLVHTPLVAPLLEAVADGAEAAVAVVPGDVLPPGTAADDLAPGAVAGAAVVVDGAEAAIAALAAGGDLDAVRAAVPAALAVPHGPIARHPVRTPAERAAAERMLYRILVKPQDNVITRYLYRPVSLPLTKLLVKTPITPNQVSLLVALIVGVGIWLTASASPTRVLVGTIVVLAGSYLDCCDGEIARVKLLSSKFGAWIDTVVDELSTIGYMAALGYHCYLHYGRAYFGDLWARTSPDPWLLAIAVSAVGFAVSIYVIYWNIITLVGSANSQDYVGRFDVVDGEAPGTMRLVPAAATAVVYTRKPLPSPLRQLVAFLPNVVRRDFISWGAVVMAALSLAHLSFALQALGTLVTSIIVVLDHVRVRRQLRGITRAGKRFEAPA